jgi:hypothetical protein
MEDGGERRGKWCRVERVLGPCPNFFYIAVLGMKLVTTSEGQLLNH